MKESRIYGMAAGRINLNTGRTKYFNVLENNTENDALVLVQETYKKDKYVVIAGSGSPESYNSYANSKEMSMLSQGRFSRSVNGVSVFPNTKEGLQEIKEKIGNNKCSFWVFK